MATATATSVKINPKGELPGGVDEKCYAEIPLHSPGLWGLPDSSLFLDFNLPLLLLQLAVIFLLTQSLHLVLKRIRLPRLISEILAGIILGPTMLGKVPKFTENLFPQSGEVFIDLMSKIGYIFFIFLSGVKMDPKVVLRSGSRAWTIGLLAVILPVASFASLYFGFFSQDVNLHRYRQPATQSIFLIQGLIAFPVVASLLVDLKIMNSELGRLALASSLISDLFSNLGLTIFSTLRIGFLAEITTVISVQSFVLLLGIILLIVFTVRPFSLWVIKRTPEGRPVNSVYIISASVAVFLAVILVDNAGLNYQYGPFILGLVIPDGPPLGSTLVDKLETLVSGMLAPLLITYCGMKVNLVDLYDLVFLNWVWVMVFFCLTVKYASVFLPALACKVPPKDAAALAFIMISQGVIQMSFYLNNVINQTFDGETFSMLTASVLLIAALSHFCVGSLNDHTRIYAGYQKRDIQHASSNSELRLLSCAHRFDDVVGVRKLLDASFPCKESPLAVYALHLVELAGRASPVLIDHQLGQKNTSGVARSQKIVEVFIAFENQFLGSATTHFFTSMSLPRFMHQDICSLAFNKLASMIILPFHRKWNHQGKIILDSSNLRTINNNVLDLAPCSVGILIDRQKIRRLAIQSDNESSMYQVAVVFMGGNDDREALAYAKRMSRSPGLQLTVVRFVSWDIDVRENQWDAVLDAEMLKEVRLLGQHQDNIVYREERVKDGAETALVIHAMEEAFDLIMVGRRHRDDLQQLLGLNEWNDLPELGPVGDMLAAAEINRPVSVLVVQQQIVKNK
ncbi:cation/H(+) antiporter 4-like [Solanum dulcamara]|uniref:cation/H(+) antiporter 4-like n=1 Tax=Solanum dulcamara TaxID=45834 RepID=UPI00248650E4|nr:cation/H(+) antiporter 4-like [Solanum dulcamara]